PAARSQGHECTARGNSCHPGHCGVRCGRDEAIAKSRLRCELTGLFPSPAALAPRPAVLGHVAGGARSIAHAWPAVLRSSPNPREEDDRTSSRRVRRIAGPGLNVTAYGSALSEPTHEADGIHAWELH